MHILEFYWKEGKCGRPHTAFAKKNQVRLVYTEAGYERRRSDARNDAEREGEDSKLYSYVRKTESNNGFRITRLKVLR
jgi:hypothetical protein